MEGGEAVEVQAAAVEADAEEAVALAQDVEEQEAELARRCFTAGRTASASTSEPYAPASYQATWTQPLTLTIWVATEGLGLEMIE